MKYQQTALLLQQIESELTALQLWTDEIPSAEALASTAPFACDLMTLAQWLQFIFLPRMQALLDGRLPLPLSCSIYPMAELAWAPITVDKLPLLSQIKALDFLLNEAKPPQSGQH
jgi:dTDP-4-dehydrorhamnose 3,5-epimerase